MSVCLCLQGVPDNSILNSLAGIILELYLVVFILAVLSCIEFISMSQTAFDSCPLHRWHRVTH